MWGGGQLDTFSLQSVLSVWSVQSVHAVNLEPPSRRQEISGPWEINPYKFVSPIYWKSARFCPDRAEGRSRPPALYRSRLEQEAEAPPKRRTSSFCAD